MRITVSHNKGKEEAMRIVNTATDTVLRPMFSGPIQMTDVQKQWQGSRLLFSLMAGMGIARVPIKGWILATDTDITIDCDLPEFIEQILPQSVRSKVQSAVRGLLK
jgi:hypothetical protein